MIDSILFLDIDGVLHPWRRDAGLLYRAVPVFENALRANPDIDVVISSDRRIHESLDDLREHFSPDIKTRIIDVNPFFSELIELESVLIPEILLPHQRHVECLTWLDRNRSGGRASWVAIEILLTTFIHCSPTYFGLKVLPD